MKSLINLIEACPYCQGPVELATGEQIYPHRRDLWAKRFWQCELCDAYVGCHMGSTKPLGRLANAELRLAKMAAHKVFDPRWRNVKSVSRSQAYAWLAKELDVEPDKCHIGMFDVEMCTKVVTACEPEAEALRRAK